MMQRRVFLQSTATALGGLLITVSNISTASALFASDEMSFAPNAFLRIDVDGRVTFVAPVPEMGQGVRTGLAMIIAEELGVHPPMLHLEQADLDEARYGPRQRAGGSGTIKSYWEPLRRAGAAARYLLTEAAAQRWRVPFSECEARNGTVVHRRTMRTLSYGELATAAAALPVPADVALKQPSQFTVVGRATPNLDIAAITSGQVQFGIDIERPGMLRAVIARCPIYGGRVNAVDASATRRVRGVVDVVQMEPLGTAGRPYMQGGVAVLATSTWAALKGCEALQVTWHDGPNASESSRALAAVAKANVQRPGTPVLVRGDALTAISNAAIQIAGEYQVPFLAHAPLEPMNCVADVRDNSCELWAPAQVPAAARTLAAMTTGLPEATVTVHITRMGGGFGRRLSADYVGEAAFLSKTMKRPVQVVWTRVDDMRHGFFRPFGYHRLQAGLDTSGNIVGWSHHVSSTSRYAFRPNAEPHASEVHGGDFPGNVLPNVRVAFTDLESSVQRGPWRSPRNNANTFVLESFLDEVAHAAHRDPLALRRDLLGAARKLPYGDDDPLDTGRLRQVLDVAAARAGWGNPLPAGRAHGIASCFAFDSYVAHVAEVSVDRATGRIRVHKIVAAMDCGLVVNPSGVRAQVEGAAVDALSSLYRDITFENGRVQQSTYQDYRMLRFDDTPDIDVILIPSDHPPTGAGEPPFPSVMPAVLNAVFAATGVRIRTLPVNPTLLRA